MCLAPSMRAVSHSQGSRTSSSVNASPCFCKDLTWPAEISKSMKSPLTSRTWIRLYRLQPSSAPHCAQASESRDTPQDASADPRVTDIGGGNCAPKGQQESADKICHQ